MPSDTSPPPTSRDGFALVAVLWLAGLIAAIAAGFAVSVRLNVLTHAAALHGLELEAAADGLARLTAFRLAAEPATPQPAPGAALACRWSRGISAELLIQDHAGLIDLNAVSPDLIARLIAGLGAAPGLAEEIAKAIRDFSDTGATEDAGEPAAYPGQGFGPKNAAFDAIEELDQIPGMTEPLYRALLPHVTVHSLQAGFDPAAMTPELKRMLRFSPSGEPPPDLATLVVPSQKRFYSIDVRVATKAGARYRRMAVVELQPGNPDRPFTIVAWQRGGDFAMGPPAATPCFETVPAN